MHLRRWAWKKVPDSDLVITGVVSQTLAFATVEVGKCSVMSVTAKAGRA
jgi:hypothetical protein